MSVLPWVESSSSNVPFLVGAHSKHIIAHPTSKLQSVGSTRSKMIKLSKSRVCTTCSRSLAKHALHRSKECVAASSLSYGRTYVGCVEKGERELTYGLFYGCMVSVLWVLIPG